MSEFTQNTGRDRLLGLVEVWGNYIPTVYGVAKVPMAMKDSDPEAEAAWNDRMAAVHGLCEETISSMAAEGHLTEDLTPAKAVDVLFMLISVRNWEQLTRDLGWTQSEYLAHLEQSALKLLAH